MPIIRRLVIVIFLPLFLFGCSDLENQNNVDFNIIAAEKTLPSNFEELADQSQTSPFSRYLIKKATDSTQLKKHWQLYGLAQPIEEIDFTKYDVFFFGLYESSSCPNDIQKLQFDQETRTLTVPITSPGGDCTADAGPKTIAIQLEKELSAQIHEILVLEYNTETKIPITATN